MEVEKTSAPIVIFTKPADKVSSKSGEKIREVFKEVDINDDKLIDWEEINLCCENLQIELTEADKKIYDACDDDDNGGLDIDEFINFVHYRLRTVFDEIDADKSGELDHEEVMLALTKMKIQLSDRQISSIMQEIDQNGDGVIDFNEFCEFFSDVPTLSLQTLADRWMCGEGLDVGSDSVPLALPPVEIPVYRYMMSGALAGVVSRSAVAPLEKIKILAQTTSSAEKISIKISFSNIVKTQGVRGLFNGNLANCLRIAPSGACVSLVYSQMIKYTPVDNTKNPHQPMWRLLSGASAGIVSTTVTHPLDVVRARLTIQDRAIAGHYTGIFNTFTRITTEEGFRGLYKGLSPALISVAPFLAIQQCSYDVMKLSVTETKYGKHPATFLACGAFAGALAQTFVHPLEVVRRLEQIETTSRKMRRRADSGVDRVQRVKHSSRSVMKMIWRDGGIRRCYAGLLAGYLKVVPSAAISLIVRDTLLGRLKD